MKLVDPYNKGCYFIERENHALEEAIIIPKELAEEILYTLTDGSYQEIRNLAAKFGAEYRKQSIVAEHILSDISKVIPRGGVPTDV